MSRASSACAVMLAAGSSERTALPTSGQKPARSTATDDAAARLRREAIHEAVAEAGDGGRKLLLESAGEIGRTEYVKELLAAGAPAACSDINGCTPLHRAAFGGCKATAEALIAADSQVVHAVDFMRNTPLHAAAFAGHEEIVALLIKANADVTAADAVGNQAIHRAVIENHPTVATRLLSARASANAPGAERNTPLHAMALVCLDDLRLAELLLAFGGSPTRGNRYGKTALELARYHGQAALARRLQQHVAEPWASHLKEALQQPLATSKGATALSPRSGASIVNVRGNSDLTLQEYPSSLAVTPGKRLSLSAASPSVPPTSAQPAAATTGTGPLAPMAAAIAAAATAAAAEAACSSGIGAEASGASGTGGSNAAADTGGVATQADIFAIACEGLEAAPCQLAIETFRTAHRDKFRDEYASYLAQLRWGGGSGNASGGAGGGASGVSAGGSSNGSDLVASLHHEFASMIGEHLQAGLGALNVPWPTLIRACERAVLDGRCGGERLKLLRPLVAVDDLAGFWDLMSSTVPNAILGETTAAVLAKPAVAATAAEAAGAPCGTAAASDAVTRAGHHHAVTGIATSTALSVSTPEEQPLATAPIPALGHGPGTSRELMLNLSSHVKPLLSRQGSHKAGAHVLTGPGGNGMVAAARAAAAAARSRAAAGGAISNLHSPLKRGMPGLRDSIGHPIAPGLTTTSGAVEGAAVNVCARAATDAPCAAAACGAFGSGSVNVEDGAVSVPANGAASAPQPGAGVQTTPALRPQPLSNRNLLRANGSTRDVLDEGEALQPSRAPPKPSRQPSVRGTAATTVISTDGMVSALGDSTGARYAEGTAAAAAAGAASTLRTATPNGSATRASPGEGTLKGSYLRGAQLAGGSLGGAVPALVPSIGPNHNAGAVALADCAGRGQSGCSTLYGGSAAAAALFGSAASTWTSGAGTLTIERGAWSFVTGGFGPVGNGMASATGAQWIELVENDDGPANGAGEIGGGGGVSDPGRRRSVRRWTRGRKLGHGTSGTVYVAVPEPPAAAELPGNQAAIHDEAGSNRESAAQCASGPKLPYGMATLAAGSGLEAARGLSEPPKASLPWSLAPSQLAERATVVLEPASSDDMSAQLAAKLVLPRDAEAAAALREEIGLMRRLRHPHVVRYHGCGVRGDEQVLHLGPPATAQPRLTARPPPTLSRRSTF